MVERERLGEGGMGGGGGSAWKQAGGRRAEGEWRTGR